MGSTHAIILAAGRGKRMQGEGAISDLPKVLHLYQGKPLLWHVLDAAHGAELSGATVVVGYQKENVEASCKKWSETKPNFTLPPSLAPRDQAPPAPLDLTFVDQGVPQGTGHAVLAAESSEKKAENVLILLGDVPRIQSSTLVEAISTFDASLKALCLTMELKDPTGYGRIVRDENQQVVGIVEERDATPEQKAIREVNTGIFLFRTNTLWPALKKITNRNNQGEYYLTDIIQILREQNHKVGARIYADADQFRGINSIQELQALESLVRKKAQMTEAMAKQQEVASKALPGMAGAAANA